MNQVLSLIRKTILNILFKTNQFGYYFNIDDNINSILLNKKLVFIYTICIGLFFVNNIVLAAPIIFPGTMDGILSPNTSSVVISITTNENATCKYGDDRITGVDYNLLPYTFTNTGGTSHSTVISGLTNGNSYFRSIRCSGSTGVNNEDYVVFWYVSPTMSPRIDVNNSENLNTFDASLVLRYSLGFDLSGTGWIDAVTTGDANCNGNVNTFDANLLFRKSLGLNMDGTGWGGDYTSPDCSVIDYTAILQQIIDAMPANSTLLLPDGEYWIDAVHKAGLKLKSNFTLQLSNNAILKALPNNAGGYNVVSINGTDSTTIRGGKIMGERNQHVGTSGEWGKGILIYSATNATIDSTEITDSWGDGIYISDEPGARTNGVHLINVESTNNRRQGLSVISGSNITITNGNYSYTHGTAPSAGIDLEPDGTDDVISHVTINGTILSHNEGQGLLLYTTHGGIISDINVSNATVADNADDGIYMFTANTVSLQNNTVTNNGSNKQWRAGIKMETGSNIIVDNNHITDNVNGRRGVVVSTDSTSVNITNNNICVPYNTDAIVDLSGSATMSNNSNCGTSL